MPAYVRPTDGALRLTFHRDGQEPDHKTAADGLRAVRLAMHLIAIRDRLVPGDRLTVEPEADALPPAVPEA